MIDYLEAVLAEEREEEFPAQSRRVAVRPPEKRKKPDPIGTEKPRSPESEPAETRAAPAEGETAEVPGVTPAEETAEETAALLFGEEWMDPALQEAPGRGWISQAERPAEAAGVLLEALSRTGRSLRALRSGPGIMTGTLPEAGAGAAEEPALEALDLAMQRDARRYDGGFQLY